MDGVLIDSYSSWVLVHRRFGTDNEDSLRAFLKGEIDDMEFIRRDVERWERAAGRVSLEDVHRVLDKAPMLPGAIETLKELKKRGVTTAIVSGGLRYLAERIGRLGGVDLVLANDVQVDGDGNLTGRGIVNVPLREKGSVVSSIQDTWGFTVDETAVVGDTPVDVTMFRVARVSIAFNPTDEFTRLSATHVIEGGDLRLILPIMLGDGSA
jgi:phosphoserine phosphatase